MDFKDVTSRLGAPLAAFVTFMFAFIQCLGQDGVLFPFSRTGQHVNELRRGSGTLKHVGISTFYR